MTKKEYKNKSKETAAMEKEKMALDPVIQSIPIDINSKIKSTKA